MPVARTAPPRTDRNLRMHEKVTPSLPPNLEPCPPRPPLNTKKVSYEPDAVIETVVKAMPSAVAASARAIEIGLRLDAGACEVIDEYAKGGWLG